MLDYARIIMNQKWARYVFGILLCCLYIVGGHAIWGMKLDDTITLWDEQRINAKVISAERVSEDGTAITEENTQQQSEQTNINLLLYCRINTGKYKGETVTVTQKIDYSKLIVEKEGNTGDLVYLQVYDSGSGPQWSFAGYNRTGMVAVLVVIFAVMLIILGGIQGIRTIISLCFTALAVFYVFIPAIMVGSNVYFHTLLTSTFIILMTLFLVYGINRKSIVAAAACWFGIIVALLLTIIVRTVMHLSGYGLLADDTIVYTVLDLGFKIDLKAIMFSVVVIGSIGAIMDVAVSIVTSLEEMSEHARKISGRRILKSGLKIGRDMMGTMSNTLILAYIGSALLTVITLITNYKSVERIINSEAVIIEIMSALIGSMGLICTIPIASYLCALVYQKDGRVKKESDAQDGAGENRSELTNLDSHRGD